MANYRLAPEAEADLYRISSMACGSAESLLLTTTTGHFRNQVDICFTHFRNPFSG